NVSHLLICAYPNHRDRPSFPTRRSSDLQTHRRRLSRRTRGDGQGRQAGFGDRCLSFRQPCPLRVRAEGGRVDDARHLRAAGGCRSEEHTSELQSRFDLVCRLLLETKTSDAILTKKSNLMIFKYKTVNNNKIQTKTI